MTMHLFERPNRPFQTYQSENSPIRELFSPAKPLISRNSGRKRNSRRGRLIMFAGGTAICQ